MQVILERVQYVLLLQSFHQGAQVAISTLGQQGLQ